MLRILYGINGVFYKGGTEAVVLNTLKFIDKEKFQIDILVHGDAIKDSENAIHKELVAQGIRMHYVTPRSVDFHRNIREIRGVFKNNTYNIAHSHMDSAGYFFLREAKTQGVQGLVAHSHNSGLDLLKGKKTLKKLAHYLVLTYSRKKLRNTANFFVSCSDMAGEWLFGKKICSGNNYYMFRNAIDVSAFTFREEIRSKYRKNLCLENKLVLGHIGRFEEQKNHRFLIRIFSEISKRNADALLLLVGEGSLKEEIKQLTDEHDVLDNVRFLGTRTDIHELMCAMDVFVFPSLYEGLPVTLVEAQANGLKILASDKISRDSILTKDLILKSINDPADKWALDVLNLANHCEHSDNAVELEEKGFDMKSNVKHLEKIYLSLCKEL
jgi:glycosyltransferase involved in cell wall biosynthesis